MFRGDAFLVVIERKASQEVETLADFVQLFFGLVREHLLEPLDREHGDTSKLRYTTENDVCSLVE